MANHEDNLPKGSDLADSLDSWLRGGAVEESHEQEISERSFIERYFIAFDEPTSSEELPPEYIVEKHQMQGAMFKKWVDHTKRLPSGTTDTKFEADMTVESLASTADKYLTTLKEDLTLATSDGQNEENTIALITTAIEEWENIVEITKFAADPTNPYHDKLK